MKESRIMPFNLLQGKFLDSVIISRCIARACFLFVIMPIVRAQRHLVEIDLLRKALVLCIGILVCLVMALVLLH
jgi:hypothetical protein